MEQNKFIRIDSIEKIFYGALGDKTVVFESGKLTLISERIQHYLVSMGRVNQLY